MPIPTSHILFELGIYALTVFTVRHVWQHDREPSRSGRQIVLLASAVVFGLLVELAGASPRLAGSELEQRFLTADPSYTYGRFVIMIKYVPLCVALAWGLIIYAALHILDLLRSIPWFLQPPVAALFGVALDFVIDPVAANKTGLGMWFWHDVGVNNIYGVPLENFAGWWLVLAIFSFFTLLSRRLLPLAKSLWIDVVTAIVVVCVSTWVLAQALNFYVEHFVGKPIEPVIVFGLLALGLICFLWRAPHSETGHPLVPLLAVPGYLLSFFFVFLFISGVFLKLKGLWIFTTGSLLVGLAFWIWPCSTAHSPPPAE